MQCYHYDFVNYLLKVAEVVKNQGNFGINVWLWSKFGICSGIISLGKNISLKKEASH
jgi:hypothetical protein